MPLFFGIRQVKEVWRKYGRQKKKETGGMKRIVMVVGGVETLEYFSYQMGKTFVELGYQVFYYDLKNEAQSARTLRKFIRVGETALVTFNFEGLEKEPATCGRGQPDVPEGTCRSWGDENWCLV